MDTSLIVAVGGVCTALGAVGSSFVNGLFSRRSQQADAQSAQTAAETGEADRLRDELWTELRSVRTELRSVQVELSTWKDRYYELVADHAKVKSEYAAFRADVTIQLATLHSHDPQAQTP